MRVEPLDEDELALYQRLKEITDSRRLNAMMPAWIKAHNRAVAAPKPLVFVPDEPPKFPSRCTVSFGIVNVLRDASRIPALRVLANGREHKNYGKPAEYRDRTMREYIREFDALNTLKPCPTELVNS